MLSFFFSVCFFAHASLIIHYKFWTSFGQAFKDFSGNGNHGVNGDTINVEALDGVPTDRGLYMNGNNQVRLPPNELVPAGFSMGTKYSMTAWVMPFAPDFVLFEKMIGAPKYLRWRHFISMMHIEMDDGTGFQFLHCDVMSFTPGQWMFYVVTVDMSIPSFIITMPVFSSCFSSNSLYNFVDSPTLITYTGRPLNGVLYEFRFYNHIITLAEYSPLSVSPGSAGCSLSCPARCAPDPTVTCLPACSSATDLDDCTTACSCGTFGCTGTATTCVQCHVTCQNTMCTGLTYQDCVLGQNCDPSCSVCSGLTSKDCVTCTDANTNLVAGVCSCMNGYYLSSSNPFVCTLCNSLCKTCSGGTSSSCLTCSINAGLSGASPNSCACNAGFFPSTTVTNCKACDSTCKTCSAIDVSSCLTCLNNAVLTGSSPNTCGCSPGFFPNPTVSNCKACDSTCKTCSAIDASSCLTCLTNAVLAGASPNSCICSPGWFPSPTPANCLPCAVSCKTCSAGDIASCLTCFDPAEMSGPAPSKCVCVGAYFPSPTPANCIPCHGTCETCVSGEATGCVTCYDFADMKDPPPTSCACNSGYFLNSNRCKLCDLSCDSCVSTEAKGCLTCKVGAALVGTPPGVCKCKQGFYPDNGGCLPCYEGCATCSDASTCLTCKANATLKDFVCVCVDGYFGSASSCQQCAPGCGSCSSEKCDKCGPGQIKMGMDCVDSCPSGFKQNSDLTCEQGSSEPPIASLSVNSDNSLAVSFDKEMNCTISVSDVNVIAQNLDKVTIDVTWQEPIFQGSQTLIVNLVFQTAWVSKGSTVDFEFLNPESITDVFGIAITNGVLSGTLNEFGTKPDSTTTTAVLLNSGTAQQAAAASKGSVSAGVATSFLNGSPAGLISLINQLQLITYLAMTKLPLPADFASSLAASNVGSMLPNPFSKYFQSNDTTQIPPKHVQDYGISSTLFLTNSVTFLGTSALILSSYLPIYLLSKSRIGFISTYFKAMLPSFRWGVPIKMWLTSYLDLGVFCLLQLSNKTKPFGTPLNGLSTIVAGFTALLFAVTPLCVIFFTYRNFNYISSRGDRQFNQKWGALFLEFREGQDLSSVAHYSLFAVRRAVLAFSLVLADDYLAVIALLNSSFCMINLLFLLFCRPYKEKLDLAEFILVESGTTLVYLVASSFLLDISDRIKSVLSSVGVWTVRVTIGLNVVMSVIRTVMNIVDLLRLYRDRMKMVNMKYQLKDAQSTITGANSSQQSIITNM